MRRLATRIPEPWAPLGLLLAVQWIALLALALTVRHNGWLYYQGGDQTYYYTTSWMIGDLILPITPIGYGWSFVLTPVSLLAGSSFLSALPAIVLLNTVVLLPVALLCVYGIAARIGGRLIGYLAAALWIALPYAAIPLFVQRYHEKWTELTLPQTLGFSGLADFPSMVCLLIAAYLVVRTIDTNDWRDAALSGLATGFAIGIKPSNAIFLAAPVVALALARRWRALPLFAAALVLPVVTLAIWKERGLGRSPAVASGELGLLTALLPLGSLFDPVTRYLDLDWGHLHQNLDNLREFFWAVRPLQWIPLAGAIAIGRRSWPKAALVFLWFAAFFFLKGADSHARVEDSSFWRLLMPSYPAYVLLFASVPLLVPTLGRRLAGRFAIASRPRRLPISAVAASAVVFVALPLLLVVAIPQQQGREATHFYENNVFVPVSGDLAVRVEPVGRAFRITWDPPYASATPFYRVFRSRAFFYTTYRDPPVIRGLQCRPQSPGGANECQTFIDTIGLTPRRSWIDRPPPGRWTYRVGLLANWRNEHVGGDVLLISLPVTVTVPKR